MKKLYSVFLVVLACGLTHAAQAQQGPSTLKEQAMEDTRRLSTRVALDDARSMQVRRLTLERLTQESEVKATYANDPAMLQNKLRMIEQNYGEKLKGILTEAQYQRYVAQLTPAPAVLVSGATSSKP